MLRFLAVLFLTLAPVVRAEDAPKQPDKPAPAPAPTPSPVSVFKLPQIQGQFAALQMAARAAMQKGDAAGAQKLVEQSLTLIPDEPGALYNLACALALQGKKDEALTMLEKAVKEGFNQAQHIREDKDLASLRADERFEKAAKAAETAKPAPSPLFNRTITPSLIEKGEARVGEANTVWDPRFGVFRVFFRSEGDLLKKSEPIKGWGEAGDLIRKWHSEGTAAGNVGDLYDNHDGDHSNMGYESFPQLTRVEFDKPVIDLHMHSGFQGIFFYNGVTFGNSSTALVSGPFWRSQTRLGYTNPRNVAILYLQYTSNHLFMYPEHRDHDPGHNGGGTDEKGEKNPDGFGDVYPTNTPYVITSQGSSGSDRPFMDAIAATLAAFQPETKAVLTKHGLIAPTLQMIFRRGNKNIADDKEYLTGKAHPPVFEGGNVNVLGMVKLAHEIKPTNVPPLVQLVVKEEDRGEPGRDYMDVNDGAYAARGPGTGRRQGLPAPELSAPSADREKLFDTPCAIARVFRTTKYQRRMVVSAEASRDVNGKALSFHWSVLRGKGDQITIKPLNDAKSVVEIVIPYHERFAFEAGPPAANIETNRVDIGCFAHNGDYYSAPAFVTCFFLDNEKREYDEQKRIKVMDYGDPAKSKNYVDPLVDLPRHWRDEYRYDEKGSLLGWTRKFGDKLEEYNADGLLVTKRDDAGRVMEARTVRYLAKQEPNQAAKLERQAGDEVVIYEYASADDRVGKVKARKKAK